MPEPERSGASVEAERDPTDNWIVWLVTNPVTTWVIRTFSARIDRWQQAGEWYAGKVLAH